MTDDKELIARLRYEANTDGYDYHGDLHEKSADRIEALSAERDRWKGACRSASRDLNIVVPDNDRLKSERDAAEAKLARAVEAGVDVAASLNAATSLLERGGKRAAASDKMFDQMLMDYNASLDRFRATLAEISSEAALNKGENHE